APEGPAKGAVGYEYIFSSETTDPNGDEIYYMFDWGDGDFSEWVGPFPSGETGKASHIWNDEGYFDVSVKARDENGAQSDWSETSTIELVYNYPPDKPDVSGPVWLFPKLSYKFDFSTSDPDDEDVFYWIEWGDGEIEEWIGPYSSGEEFTLSHSYDEKGDYLIVVKAKDTMDIESELREKYIRVSYSRNRVIINPFLQRLIQTLFNQLPLFK
ncbi:MAG: PKD domain-containing protein, partial [Thermoplasmatales archaeon]